MIALNVTHLHRLDAGQYLAAAEQQAVGRVVELRVAAPLSLQHQREGRVAPDFQPGDVVHLEGDGQRHFLSPRKATLSRAGGGKCNGMSKCSRAHQLSPVESKTPTRCRGRRRGWATTMSKRWS